MDLIGFSFLSYQLGRVTEDFSNKYKISWITEEGFVGSLILYKHNLSLTLSLYEYFNFDVERDFRYKWKIIESSIKQTSRHMGLILPDFEHFCVDLDKRNKHITNVVRFNKFKSLVGEIVYFCLGNCTFSERYMEDGSIAIIAIKTNVLLYAHITKIHNSTLNIRCKRLRLNLKYELPDFIDVELLKNIKDIYIILDITKRDFTEFEKGVDKRVFEIEGIIIEEFGQVISENGNLFGLCFFGKVPIDMELPESINSILIRSHIERETGLTHEIYIVLEGVVDGIHILGFNNKYYELRLAYVVGNITLKNGDVVLFRVDKEEIVRHISFSGKIKGYPTKLCKKKDVTKFYEKGCDIVYNKILNIDKMYEFSIKWDKEWKRFIAIDVEEVPSEDPLDIYKKEKTNKKKGTTYKPIHKYCIQQYPNIYQTNVTQFQQGYKYRSYQYYQQPYEQHISQNVNPDDIW
eukprot:TRINITY_DN9513_c0_g1_i1.p1 TRINITY_DN9513_c0_g1~~TRINITY_DN9513_c0_g1_i1.p1  ORF type:complete len:462 (+),score=51.16 TRINITY_DN9513_c0_g1_i1:38-1423(+)